MNQQKVFETRMLLDNKLKTTSSKENQNGTTKRASLNAEAELNPPFLTKLRAKLEGSVRHEKQEKIVDTLEYVNTNSRMLADIMEHCKAPESGTTLAEGDLAYIGDVSLELINEEEIRGIMAIMSGTFDGITVPDAGDLDIGHMMPAAAKNKTTTTVTKATVSTPSKSKSATATTVVLPKTGDSNWITASVALFLLGTLLMAAACRC